MTPHTREYLENILRNRFYELDLEMEYIYNETDKIIATCKELGLYDLLEEIQLTK